jgi:hypothetical protein
MFCATKLTNKPIKFRKQKNIHLIKVTFRCRIFALFEVEANKEIELFPLVPGMQYLFNPLPYVPL